MSLGARRRQLSSLVLARKGTSIPAIPKDFAGYVEIEKVSGLCQHSIPANDYDEWLVRNAKADFTGRGSLRLEDKKGRTRTWVSGKDMENIFGHDGNGRLKLNHRICFESGCGHRAIYNGEYYDEKLGCKIVMFKCTKCGAVKKFPKRPTSHSSKKHGRQKPSNFKSKFVNNRPNLRQLPFNSN